MGLAEDRWLRVRDKPAASTDLIEAAFNLRLCRKRSNPEYEDVQLLSMAIDPIEEAADDLIVEDDSD